MSRAPSPETALRNVTRKLRETEKRLDAANMSAAHYRNRATKAEQECAEWRKRFDALLLRTPETQR